jgi:NTE family protein
MQELGFKTHFYREMNVYARASLAAKDSNKGWGSQGRGLQEPRFHMIDSHLDALQHSETKMLTYAPFLEMLRDQGREQARLWLAQDAAAVGRRSSVDLAQWLA